jgi:hypothetical protein
VFSAPVVSVSMSIVLRGAKKLRVNTAFGGSLTAADVGTDLVDFLAVCVVSLLPGSRRPGPLIPLRFCSLYHFVLPVHSPSGRSSIHSMLPCICSKER